jgi:hypothetical protein
LADNGSAPRRCTVTRPWLKPSQRRAERVRRSSDDDEVGLHTR